MKTTIPTSIKFIIVSSIALSCSVQSQSQKSEPAYRADTLLVTASRGEESLSDTLASVSVISRDDIELSQAPDLLELLRLQTGIDIVRSGPAGAQTSVFLRGTNSNHTLVLIDGVRVNSTNTGSLAWENLPIAQIERIEIVRGPRASFYGADAIGGVIQIFTREANRNSARVSLGSYSSKEITASSGYHSDKSAFNITADWRDSDGFSSQNENGFAFDPDDDGYNTWNVSARGRNDLSAGSAIAYSVLYTNNENQFDQGKSQSEQQVFGLAWDFCKNCKLAQVVNLGYTKDTLESQTAFGQAAFKSDHFSGDWQGRLQLAAGQLSFGLDYDTESGRKQSDYNESRNNLAAWSGFDLETGLGEGQFVLRLDDNSVYGNNFTGTVAWGFNLGDSFKLIPSYGTAFRAPTMGELYSPGFFGSFAGNANLNAESSESAELALRWVITAQQSLNINLFRTRISDMIAFAGVDFQAININKAAIDGLEAEYAFSNTSWQFKVNATFQETEDKSTGAKLLRRPDTKYSMVLDRRFRNGAWFGAEYFYNGQREDFGASLKSYSLVNLRAGVPFGSGLRLEGRLENLLDENYQPAFGFNAAGRSYFVSLNWLQE